MPRSLLLGVITFATLGCGGVSASPDARVTAPTPPQPGPGQPPADPVPSVAMRDCGIIVQQVDDTGPPANGASAGQCMIDSLGAGRPARMTTYYSGDEGEGGPVDYEVVQVSGAWQVRMTWDGRTDGYASAPVVGTRLCRTAAMEDTVSGAKILNTRDCGPDQPATAPQYCGRIVEGSGASHQDPATVSQCLIDALAARRPARLVRRRVTIEGATIMREYQVTEVEGRWVVRVRVDMSADPYAPRPAISSQTCARVTMEATSQGRGLTEHDCR